MQLKLYKFCCFTQFLLFCFHLSVVLHASSLIKQLVFLNFIRSPPARNIKLFPVHIGWGNSTVIFDQYCNPTVFNVQFYRSTSLRL